MTWEQKLLAIKALARCDTSVGLHMRRPGDWYVGGTSINIKSKNMLSSVSGGGPDPETAVDRYWDALTGIGPEQLLVVHGDLPDRGYRWNGFMWATEKI
jgi:hypothetical protein